MYFFDYGNAFLLETGRAGADIYKTEKPIKVGMLAQRSDTIHTFKIF